MVQAPSSKVKRNMKKLPQKVMFAQQTITGRSRRLAPNLELPLIRTSLKTLKRTRNLFSAPLSSVVGPYIALLLSSFFFTHPFTPFCLCRNRGGPDWPSASESSQSRDFSLTLSALPQHHYSVQYISSVSVNVAHETKSTA